MTYQKRGLNSPALKIFISVLSNKAVLVLPQPHNNQNYSIPQVLTPVGESDIPTELVDRLQEEKKIEVVRRKEKSEAHLYMNLKVMFEDCFHGHQGNDLYDTERVNANFSQEVKQYKDLFGTK